MSATTVPSYRVLFWTLALIGCLTDLGSKYLIFRWLDEDPAPHGSREVVPGVFRLLAQYREETDESTGIMHKLRTWSSPRMPRVNQGALFGMGGRFQHRSNSVFAVVSLAAALGITIWSFFPSAGRDRLLCLALGLILGGTLGNLFDRVVFGGVRDFLDFYLIDWPVFNIADCCLVCGAGLLMLHSFRTPPVAQEQAIPAEAKEPGK